MNELERLKQECESLKEAVLEAEDLIGHLHDITNDDETRNECETWLEAGWKRKLLG